MKFIKLFIVLFVSQLYAQQGGMWIPSLLKGRNETEMKSLGMKITADDIYSINHSSLKDAVPHFDGGCTAEVISAKGLILTNHHCGYDNIQSLSSVAHDYLTNGFWAIKPEDELPNKDLFVTFVVKIEDVTTQVLQGTTSNTTEAEKQKIIQTNIATLTQTFPKQDWQENKISTFYDGNQYLLFVTETYNDIRLVGAPPSAIGKFGSDTDNWVWPRHAGDFCLFRIYADKNNRPANYSKDNVPYTPKHFLPVSIKGIKEDDFTMVMGYPGKTQEYLPSFAINQIINSLNPAKIEIRDNALKIQDSFMRKDNAIKIQYAAKYAGVANYWKKWIGETKGLKKSNALAIKKEFEKTLQQKILQSDKKTTYASVLSDFEKNYQQIAPYALAKEYFTEIVQRNTELLSFGYRIYQLEQLYKTKGEEAFTERRNALITQFADLYKNFNPEVDAKILDQLIMLYSQKCPKELLPEVLQAIDTKKLAADLYSNSKLANYNDLKNLLSGTGSAFVDKINQDQGYVFVKQLADSYLNNVNPKYTELNLKNIALQRTYMQAILEFSPKTARIFPDANSTLRVTYGKIKGYQPSDAVTYSPFTYLDGVMEKYIPNDYEFDVPQKLIDLYNTKDYGKYGVKGKMPLAFIATNHTTGGNSGSPALDAHGNLIGLNFDRVWEGTMSDIYYDPAICRNIMVDIRYILFIIDKYAGAKHLIQEMKVIENNN